MRIPRLTAVVTACHLVSGVIENTILSELLFDHTATDGNGYIAAPSGTETLAVELAPMTVECFVNGAFEGNKGVLKLEGSSQEQPADMPEDLGDSMSSLRWNLSPGIVVMFYEDAGAKGEQLVIWGKGQLPHTARLDFENKASRWMWFNIGGGAAADQSNEEGVIAPHGSEVLAQGVAENTIQYFKDRDFQGEMLQVSPATGTTAGELQRLSGEIDDSLSSVRWNLPEGVIVLLYEDADGNKDRIALWGKGQQSNLDRWDFNDKASRWSWAFIGTPPLAH